MCYVASRFGAATAAHAKIGFDIETDLLNYKNSRVRSMAGLGTRRMETMRNLNTICYTGAIWPSGKFGLSRVKTRDIDPPIKGYQLPRQSLEECEERIKNFQHYLESGEQSPLGLSSVTNSHSGHSTRAPRGSGGITSYGRNMVESAATILQEKYGRRRLSFLTLTVPSVSNEDMERICKGWAEIVRVLMQRMTRHLNRCGLPGEIVGVTEVQEMRSHSEARAVLHLHWVFVGRRNKGTWVISPDLVRYWWQETLRKYIVTSPMPDFAASENLQQVRKDAGSYLGKYISKGRDSVEKIQEYRSRGSMPSTWWNCSLSLKRLVKACKVSFTKDTAMAFVYSYEEDDNPDVIWIKTVYIPHEIFGQLGVGYVGKIKRSAIEKWRDLVELSRETYPQEFIK